jgi:tRNA A37 threonylcarbamoyltransferase TsaD
MLDAQPNAGIALSAASGDSAARHHALWTGLGVHHIETHAETDPYAESPRGLVLALVDGTHGELELRMWNLASIVNLVKWRVYSAVRRDQS